MNIKKYRIGNLIEHNNVLCRICGIESLLAERIKAFDIEKSIDNEAYIIEGAATDFSPVILTPEILMQFNIIEGEWFADDTFSLQYDDTMKEWDVYVRNVYGSSQINFTSVKYVHEFENLFYILLECELSEYETT